MSSHQRYTPRITTFTSPSDISEFAAMTNRLRWVYHDIWCDLFFGNVHPELHKYICHELDKVEVALISLYSKLMAFQAQNKKP